MTTSKYVTSVRGLLGVCLMVVAFALAGCAGEFEDDDDEGPYQTTTTAQATPATTSASSPVTTAASTNVSATNSDDSDGAATTGAMVQDSNEDAAPGKEGIGYFGPESGGTANPNDRPLALMYFESHGVNPFVDADEDPLSTFALDGDTASYEILGLYLGEAQLPPPESVRIEEYVNSLPQDYPAAEAALGLHLDAGPSPFGPEGYVLLRVGVSNPRPDTDRDPVSLIFVIDTSGSMAADNRLGLAKTIAEGIADRMIDGDRAALVTYGDIAVRNSDFVDYDDRARVVSALRGLYANGSTYAEAGLRMAYGMAEDELDEGRTVRLVLFSDGVANVGATGPESILELVDEQAHRRATLTAIGVGISGNYNDVLMEALANRGNGTYHYLYDHAAGEQYLSEDVNGVFTETARDARIQVQFNADAVRKYRLIGYENRAVADEDFEDDTLDFGEPGFDRDVTALYELRLEEGASTSDTMATVRLRWLSPGSGGAIETSESITVGGVAGGIGDTSAHFRQAAAVAELAELLRKSFWAQCSDIAAVADLLDGIEGELGEDSDYTRLVSRVARASEYFEPYCKE
ncbi:MAG: von Willebrand factor type A domain-containing protein [Chloroflexi bacterium]|nr:von Willebrand factor type A domain-containing protein [Chloroflexota bacterium]